MSFRLRRHQSGSALGEQVIFYALVALGVVGLASVFSQSVFWGFVIVGVSLAGGLLLLAFGYFQARRGERRRVEHCRAKLARAAAAQGATLDAVFMGEGEGVTTGFGIAVAARKLFYAHNGYRKPDLAALDFGDVAAAFARADSDRRYRIEVRTGGDGRMALWLRVGGREEATRWVEMLRPGLGERARFVEDGGETGTAG